MKLVFYYYWLSQIDSMNLCDLRRKNDDPANFCCVCSSQANILLNGGNSVLPRFRGDFKEKLRGNENRKAKGQRSKTSKRSE